MLSDDGGGGGGEVNDEFPANFFPCSFTLLYCPFECCNLDTPCSNATVLLDHVYEEHSLKVQNPNAVLPFLDRYLLARSKPSYLNISQEDDYELRQTLQQERLKEILDLQERERTTSHRKGRHCLFCNNYFETKLTLFDHMYKDHNFNIGQLDNLVMVEEFLDILQGKLDRHICIYCEKLFPSMPILKKHLKNKNHYRIHSGNHLYDKFYIVNYLQVGKLYDQQSAQSERDPEEVTPQNAEEDWDDLREPIDERTTCLLCPITTSDAEECIHHMLEGHDFDWRNLCHESNLGDYDIIKIINFIRVRVSELGCLYCDWNFDNDNQLTEHLTSHGKLTLPERRLWDDIRFLFPIYDDDPLLCHFESTALTND